MPTEGYSGTVHRKRLERIFENHGSAILISAVTFSPRYSISLRLPCDASRAQRGRNPALLRVHLHSEGIRCPLRVCVPADYPDCWRCTSCASGFRVLHFKCKNR
jgi:hypothetical protein